MTNRCVICTNVCTLEQAHQPAFLIDWSWGKELVAPTRGSVRSKRELPTRNLILIYESDAFSVFMWKDILKCVCTFPIPHVQTFFYVFALSFIRSLPCIYPSELLDMDVYISELVRSQLICSMVPGNIQRWPCTKLHFGGVFLCLLDFLFEICRQICITMFLFGLCKI